MLRNSIVYRRLWYVRKRNIKRIRILLRLMSAAIVLSLLAAFINGCLAPRLRELSEIEIQKTVTSLVEDTVREVMEGNLTDGNIVINVGSDTENQAKPALIPLLKLLPEKIRERLEALENKTIAVPIPGLYRKTGQTGYSPGNPSLNLAVRQVRPADAYITSDYIRDKTGLVEQKMILNVSITIGYTGFLLDGRTDVSVAVPVAEDILT